MSIFYKSEALRSLEHTLCAKLHMVDDALETCLNDYYEACETSDMMGDLLKLFNAVQDFSSVTYSDNERNDAWTVRTLIVAEMREREWEVESKYNDDALWGQFSNTLEKNMNLELERRVYELNKFRDNVKIYNRVFDCNWIEE